MPETAAKCEPCCVLILDKARALNLIVWKSERIGVPLEFAFQFGATDAHPLQLSLSPHLEGAAPGQRYRHPHREPVAL